MATTIKIEDDVLNLLKLHARRDEDYSAVISRLIRNSNWKLPTKKWYLVCTPIMPYTEVVLDDGTGPTYDVRDCALVQAYTRKDARWAAYRVWKREGSNWIRDAESDSAHPLKGVTIEEEWDSLTEEEINQWEPYVER